MRHVLPILALAISSVALALSFSLRKETLPSMPITSAPLKTVSAGSERIADIERRLVELSGKLEALERSAAAAPSVAEANGSIPGSQKLSDMERKVFELSNKLDGWARSSSASAIAEIDANLETTLKATTKNTENMEVVRKQIGALGKETQSAFNAVANELAAVRAELAKVSGAKR